MSIKLVSLAALKRRVKQETSDEDELLTDLLHNVSAQVVAYLGEDADAFLDSNGNPAVDSNEEPLDIPDPVRAAVLWWCAYEYRHPDEDPEKQYENGDVPRPVRSMLYSIRTPKMA